MRFDSKLPAVGTTVFSVISALAQRHGAINLGQGFPNFDPSPRLRSLVGAAMARGDNQYAPMPGHMGLRERIADKMQRAYGRPIDPTSEITITAGATQALFCAIAAFVRPGDEVVLIEPAYDSYRPCVELFGGKAVIYSLAMPDYRIDFSELKKLFSDKTRMIVVNTPHNPTGAVLKHHDLLALQSVLAGTDIILLSDEVYEHLIFDSEIHCSVARYDGLWERSLAVFSFGKTFHGTGWKVGYAVGPSELMAEFRKAHQFNVFSVNHPAQAALAEFMDDESEWFHLADFYQKKRDFFRKILESTRLKPLKCEGTYFQTVDFSAISDELDVRFAERLIVEHKVAAIPNSAFFSDKKDEKTLRFCFAKTEDLLEKAGEALLRI